MLARAPGTTTTPGAGAGEVRPGRARRRAATALALGVVLLLAGCGGDEAAEETASFAFGEPGDAADADRVIEIEATSPFVFEPDEVTVATGETVTFEVTNTDTIEHDFVLGDEATQEEHAAELAAAEDAETAHDDANAMAIPPGETGSITWTFTEPGTLLYGCHEPGHYDAGMVGGVTVEG